jgi:hypothetical protein
MSATLLRTHAATALAGSAAARMTRAGRGSSVRAFAKAASSTPGAHGSGSSEREHDTPAEKQAPARRGAQPPALHSSFLPRRPSSLLGASLFGDLDRCV